MTKAESCTAFGPKILAVARRVYTQVRDDAGIRLDDLVSFGVLGHLEAFERYGDGHGIEFPAFAEYRIRGAMLDALSSATCMGPPSRHQLGTTPSVLPSRY